MILECTCQCDYQDATYGQKKRVHNPMLKAQPQKFRCTICGIERSKPGAAEKEKEKNSKENKEENRKGKLVKRKS